MNPRYTKVTLLLEIIGILLGIIFLIPFYFVFINSVKGFADILIDAAAWPQEFLFSNYLKVWDIINFPRAFWNSLIITVISNIGLVVISSMAAWKMVRTREIQQNPVCFICICDGYSIPDRYDSSDETRWHA